MNTVLQDIRYALRQLRKSPGFAAVAVITLALGIGANTAIFTLVQGILLRSLPVADASRLYRIGDKYQCCVDGGFPEDAGQTGDFSIFSTDLYQYLKKSTPEFAQLAAVQAGQYTWTVRRDNALAKSMHGEFVSGNYFSTLGLGAYVGRVFADRDDTEGAPPVTVLSYPAWQNEFSADPAIVGSTIYIQARPFTVIGIAPPGFFGDRVTDTPPEFWIPISDEPYVHGDSSYLHHPTTHWLYPLGRVRPGISIPALQAKLSALLRQWAYTQPLLVENGGKSVIPRLHVVLSPGGGGIQNLQQETGTGLTMLMILSSFVLLIACANIANLLLARATTRRAEVAIRMAVGAGRRRVIRQTITESVLLSCIGGLVGLAVAYGGSRAILALAFPDAQHLPISADPSPAVLAFAFGVSLLTGILFGAGPAWFSAHAQPAEVLRGSTRTTRDRSSLPQMALVVIQVAFTLVLLAGAILMTRTLANLENQKLGVATENRYVLHLDPAGAGYTPDQLPGLYRQLQDRFSALPGVSHVGLALYSPLEGDNWGECVIPQGHPAPGPNDHCGSTWDRVSPQFLNTIGVPIVRGRGFTDQDTATAPQVALVNQAFAQHFFPGKDPIGQHFGLDVPKYSGAFEIVGVFQDFKINDPTGEVHPVYLRPLAQPFSGYKEDVLKSTEAQSMFIDSILLSFSHRPDNAEEMIRQTLAGIDPRLTVTDLRSFQSQVDGNFTEQRLVARLTGLFSLLALLLASVGLYGVMAYFVARRTGEIGIRMALGATRASVVAGVLSSALWQIGLGLVLGIPAAYYAGHLMSSQLYQVKTYDPLAMFGSAALLAVCALVAGLIPARRAASIDPMQALRTE